MVLVDTSVWIDYFNGQDNAPTNKLDTFLSSNIVMVGDIILAEVLQGFRRDADYRKAKVLLLGLDVRAIGSIGVALKAADKFRALRKASLYARRWTALLRPIASCSASPFFTVTATSIPLSITSGCIPHCRCER